MCCVETLISKFKDITYIIIRTMRLVVTCLVLMAILGQCQCSMSESTKAACQGEDLETVVCNFIPKDLKNGTRKVRIVNLIGTKGVRRINKENFVGDNWENVVYLEISDMSNYGYIFGKECFVKLVNLEEFHMHLVGWIYFSNDVFFGLNKVTTLDWSHCFRGRYDNLLTTFTSSAILPRLNYIKLSSWGVLHGAFAVNDTLIKALVPRNITRLDLSNTQISVINVTSLFMNFDHLQVLNLSYATVGEFYSQNINVNDFRHRMATADFSHLIPPKSSLPYFPAHFKISNLKYIFSSGRVHKQALIVLKLETFNFSATIPKGASVYVENVTLIAKEDPGWEIKNLVIRQNGLQRLNFKIDANFTIDKLETIDLADNDINFLHPSVLEFMPNLREIDLSKNNLSQMARENNYLFGTLLSKSSSLRKISFSFNYLRDIPVGMFKNCTKLKHIDLSHNMLKQVRFVLSDLDSLKHLDISYNDIQNLDSLSLSHLDSVPCNTGHSVYCPIVSFESNPISCSKCDTKKFIEWLTATNLTNVEEQDLKCIDARGKPKFIDQTAVHVIHKMCERKDIIISVEIASAVIALVLFVISVVLYRRRRHARKVQSRANTINKLREGDGQYEFVVFLAFSSEDQDFVKDRVRGPLNENLQLMTGIERELVCTGDEQLRCGFQIQEETWKCLDRASVVMVVVSEKFCTSGYCRSELDQAYIKRKPILLMFIEQVDESVMMPTMRELYRNNVRILWTNENGKMVLKPSWENVCKSILDLTQ